MSEKGQVDPGVELGVVDLGLWGHKSANGADTACQQPGQRGSAVRREGIRQAGIE